MNGIDSPEVLKAGKRVRKPCWKRSNKLLGEQEGPANNFLCITVETRSLDSCNKQRFGHSCYLRSIMIRLGYIAVNLHRMCDDSLQDGKHSSLPLPLRLSLHLSRLRPIVSIYCGTTSHPARKRIKVRRAIKQLTTSP